MAKKKRELVGAEREKFVAGCREQGHPDALGKELFEFVLRAVRRLRFPAAHACAYGFIAYQTAYLMAHHPVVHSAVLTSVKDDKDANPSSVRLRGMGLRVLPPDVNESR